MLPHRWSAGLRAIAIFEIIKGGLALAAFIAVAGRWLTMRELTEKVVRPLIRLFHLSPDGGFANFFNVTVAQLAPAELVWLAVAYMALRFSEAWGLWRERHWGEWLAVLSAGLYVPVEISEIIKHFTWFKVGVLVVNLAIIAFLGWVIWKTRKRKRLSARNLDAVQE